MISTHYTTAPLYLHPNGIEMEHDALWKVRVETYPAEAYSWGWEHEVTAELVRWSIDRSRDDAMRIDPEAEIVRQEELVAETFDWREAAEEEAAILADYQRDLRMDLAAE